MNKIKINLGCGKDIRKGWINVDKVKLEGIDVVHDLNKFPYPFDDSYADYILLKHVLEHLDDVVAVMNECHRILKPSGKLEIIVPYYKHKNAFTDPTHKHFFTDESMEFFIENGKHAEWYSDNKFKLISMEKKATGIPFGVLRNRFGINIPVVVSEIRWILEVIK